MLTASSSSQDLREGGEGDSERVDRGRVGDREGVEGGEGKGELGCITYVDMC